MARLAESDPLLLELAEASRALGADDRLVLGGGGNTSVKSSYRDITGRDVPVLWVKGSGHDLATITPDGFAPLRLDRVRELLPPVHVPESALLGELRCALVDAAAPDPSVETLVHALLPQTAVLHSHSDDLLILSNSVNGRALLPDVLGDCVIVDYAMPGPQLVAACAKAWTAAATDRTVGLFLQGHGLFTVGDSPVEALDRHRAIIGRAREVLSEIRLPDVAQPADSAPTSPSEQISALRHEVSRLAVRPLHAVVDDSATTRSFIADSRLMQAICRGPLTPDHVIWTRNTPCMGTDLDEYASHEHDWFQAGQARQGRELIEHDPAPRVVLDPELGLVAFGRDANQAGITAEITRHTMRAVRLAEALGGYRPADQAHIFDLEYWGFQEGKLTRTDSGKPLAGQVALVTGAASGIGRGCAAQLLDAGASVVGWDLSPKVTDTFDSPNWLGIEIDVTDADAMKSALDQQVAAFGGLDILVVAAGIFPQGANLGELTSQTWRKTMAVNMDAIMELYGLAHPLLKCAVPYGRVVLIASKNVAAPGPGAAAYSASKAGVTQLSRVAALEWAGEGIRVNMVHPDAVFDTGLWTPDLLASRAEHYGMSVEEYKRRNLLHTEITSAAVGRLAVAMCSESFACTTGAQVPIDGGNERVI
ncbi:bifunctional aldolase/short-chain dehydrogenase [Propionimicrobium sp. PCR01-08-3]|uniref:bifunctional aldolase/short-chain dehydrogenase n=1 Tax=Propionimicrobium sp. PCR01-08-3 TaxID=3052086 RepID=UPI00255C39CD|nr:bifunctional aldolase/short-chain dehydrogenase [Propionimicrobium sp. PCR01-08-3]WIY82409.1 bifunctional aldolase/short-chain dehydrogenase [Propionimicrobium sp. PCR01-08-3]